MKDSRDVLEIEDDQGTTDFFSREGWKLPDSLRSAQV